MEDRIVVIDTNIIIDFVKGGKENKLEFYLYHQQKKQITLCISVITVFEYFSGISFIDHQLYKDSELLFSQFKIQEVNEQIAKIAARLNFEKKLYQYIDLADILIASTCLYLNATLLTKNKKHFKLIPGIKFIE